MPPRNCRSGLFAEKRRIKLTFINIIKGAFEILAKNWKTILFEYTTKTLLLAAIAVILGTVIGALLSLAHMSKVKPLKWLVVAIVEFIRGTPALLQVYVIYFFVPMLIPQLNRMDPILSAFICAAVALTLNSAAYVSEIIRSGIQAVDKGQSEAARSLGLNGTTTMCDIVLPQAIKNILPTLGNEFIALVKDTSVVSFVAAVDLYKTFTEIGNVRYEYFVPYLMMAV